MEQNQPKAPNVIFLILIVLLALVVDVIQFLLDFVIGIGWIINVVLDLVFGVVFWALLNAVGLKTRGAKKKATFLVGLVANAIPVVGDIALWTFDIILLIIFDFQERKQQEGTARGVQELTPGQLMRQNTARNIGNQSNERYLAPNRTPLRNPRLK